MITFDSVGFRHAVAPEVLRDAGMTLETGRFHDRARMGGGACPVIPAAYRRAP
jgi:hypothetical protein